MRPDGSGVTGLDRGWVREPDSRGGLRRYLAIARDHWRLIAVIAGLVVVAAVAAVSLSSKTYEAEALLSVSPIATDDPRYEGLNVIRATGVPTRDVETLARLVQTAPVAEQAAQQEGVSGSPSALLGRVSASPIGGSFLVSVTAEAPDAAGAAALANAFAEGTIAVRGAQFRAQVEKVINGLERQLGATGAALPARTQRAFRDRLAQLETIRRADDPSVLLETRATPPTGPSSPGLALVLPIALVVGLLLGFGGAVAVDAASTRLRTESQLLERFDLPVLARIPRASRRGADGGAPAIEAFRDLAQSVAVLRRDPHHPRSLLFTSAGDGEDRTACAIETSLTLADAGQRVVLVDGDIRQPTIARQMGVATDYGTAAVMMGRATLDEALVEAPGGQGRLAVLSGADLDPAGAAIALSPAAIRQLLDDAAARADFVVFDAAPLGTVADALPIATTVDDVIVVVRKGQTELSALGRLANTLLRHRVVPRGFVLVGWPRRARSRRASPPERPRAEGRSGDARIPSREQLPRP